jgi:hypothetical protein
MISSAFRSFTLMSEFLMKCLIDCSSKCPVLFAKLAGCSNVPAYIIESVQILGAYIDYTIWLNLRSLAWTILSFSVLLFGVSCHLDISDFMFLVLFGSWSFSCFLVSLFLH